jgi:2-polyprenyl-3-methyl-5-hydroxy-6-metoxy-1,4-benzoquinol methylase
MDLKRNFNFLNYLMRVCPNCGSNEYSIELTEKEFKIVRCKKCSLIYLLNPPDESEIYEEYYDIQYSKDDYQKDSKFPHLAEIFAINEQRISYLKKYKSKGKLLDIGCGNGLFIKTASEAGYECYGIDVSKKALEFASKEFELSVSDKKVENLINENKKFDVITLWHVLEHFWNPIDELKKIRSLLNDNGILFLEVPNWNSIKFKLSKTKWKGGNHPLYHRSFFTSDTLKETLKLAGFDKTERVKVSYKLPRKSRAYNAIKDVSNVFAMDAFLDFAAFK